MKRVRKYFISIIHNFQDCFNRSTYLILLRRTENKQNSDTGLGLNTATSPMCIIKSPLNLPHRLNGIIIGRNVTIGNNVTIYQNVTIAEAHPNKRIIIGDNVMIGANVVITKDIPRGS